MFIGPVISCSLADDAINIMDDDNIAIALKDQSQISVPLIGTVRINNRANSLDQAMGHNPAEVQLFK